MLVCIPILAFDLLFFSSNMLKLTGGGYFPVLVASVLIVIMLIWKWGRLQISQAFHRFGVREGKKIGWLVALRDMLDDIEIAIEEDLPHARMLVQGRRRLVESDRAAVFLCSRPIHSTDDYVPVVLRVFLEKIPAALPSHIVLMHVNQTSQPYANPVHRYHIIHLGHDIDSIIVTYGYLEQPNIRGALRSYKQRRKSISRRAAGSWKSVKRMSLFSRILRSFKRCEFGCFNGSCAFRRLLTNIWG